VFKEKDCREYPGEQERATAYPILDFGFIRVIRGLGLENGTTEGSVRCRLTPLKNAALQAGCLRSSQALKKIAPCISEDAWGFKFL
jgi:hypothetical protein